MTESKTLCKYIKELHSKVRSSFLKKYAILGGELIDLVDIFKSIIVGSQLTVYRLKNMIKSINNVKIYESECCIKYIKDYYLLHKNKHNYNVSVNNENKLGLNNCLCINYNNSKQIIQGGFINSGEYDLATKWIKAHLRKCVAKSIFAYCVYHYLSGKGQLDKRSLTDFINLGVELAKILFLYYDEGMIIDLRKLKIRKNDLKVFNLLSVIFGSKQNASYIRINVRNNDKNGAICYCLDKNKSLYIHIRDTLLENIKYKNIININKSNKENIEQSRKDKISIYDNVLDMLENIEEYLLSFCYPVFTEPLPRGNNCRQRVFVPLTAKYPSHVEQYNNHIKNIIFVEVNNMESGLKFRDILMNYSLYLLKVLKGDK